MAEPEVDRRARDDIRVVGTARTDDLLSLDEAAIARRDMMIGMAQVMRRTALMLSGTAAAWMWDRMYKPVPGDLVVEVSTFRADEDSRLKGFGILLDEREEHGDVVSYVQYGPDPEDVCRWGNAQFVAVLTRWEPPSD